jgi:hypothetical protein
MPSWTARSFLPSSLMQPALASACRQTSGEWEYANLR